MLLGGKGIHNEIHSQNFIRASLFPNGYGKSLIIPDLNCTVCILLSVQKIPILHERFSFDRKLYEIPALLHLKHILSDKLTSTLNIIPALSN